MVSDVFMAICALLGVIGLIFLTYYSTRWLNKKFRSTGYYGSQNGIRIIECLGIAQDKQLLAVKVGKKAMLLGVTSQSVTKLCDLEECDLQEIEEQQQNTEGKSFAESFKKLMGAKAQQDSGSVREEVYTSNDKDEF